MGVSKKTSGRVHRNGRCGRSASGGDRRWKPHWVYVQEWLAEVEGRWYRVAGRNLSAARRALERVLIHEGSGLPRMTRIFRDGRETEEPHPVLRKHLP